MCVCVYICVCVFINVCVLCVCACVLICFLLCLFFISFLSLFFESCVKSRSGTLIFLIPGGKGYRRKSSRILIHVHRHTLNSIQSCLKNEKICNCQRSVTKASKNGTRAKTVHKTRGEYGFFTVSTRINPPPWSGLGDLSGHPGPKN